MRIVNQSSEADGIVALATKEWGDDWKGLNAALQAAAKGLVDSLNAPIDLSRATKVRHDAKTDRYQITFIARSHGVSGLPLPPG